MDWSIMFSGTSLILCGLFFFYFRGYLRRRTGSERLLSEFREEVYKLIAEIDAATDKDALLVEERIKTLRSILEDVDKRIGVHIREIDRRRFQEEAYAELGRKRSIIGSFSGTVPSKTPKVVELFPDIPPKNPELVVFPEKSEGSGSADMIQEPPPLEKPNPPPKLPHIVVPEQQLQPKPPPLREQIVELSRAGLDPSLIALRLGVGVAEVETVLAIAKEL
ncbi:MAG: hypothetical protein LBD29_01565 [Treponema sp.]|jgi:hypothetical protein|nr:hypothetical protein [Treponema sp.]